MKKDRIFIAIVIFFITILLVSLMSVQFKTIDETNVAEIETMQEAELRAEISNWKNKYNETTQKIYESNQKISEYQERVNNNQEASELLNEELNQTNLVAGKTKVKGEGVIVTLQDTDESFIESDDLVELVNELRYAGAEAISINEQRIVYNSDIVAIGTKYILVNGERVSSPYKVRAIGNQKYLESTLNLKNSGFVDRYNSSGKSVTVTESIEIEIPEYTGTFKTTYMKEVK